MIIICNFKDSLDMGSLFGIGIFGSRSRHSEVETSSSCLRLIVTASLGYLADAQWAVSLFFPVIATLD